MKHHYHLIINSNAGSGNGKKIGNRLLEILSLRGESFTPHFTHYAGEEVKIATELMANELVEWDEAGHFDPFPLLVVVGGDGTLHQVMNALHASKRQIPVAFIPAGSGNDFARGFGISQNVDEAFQQILDITNPREIYTLSYKNMPEDTQGIVLNNFGIGIDAAVVHATNASTSKRTLNKYKLGNLAYSFSILGVLFKQKGFPIKIKTDSLEFETTNAFLVTATNHPYFGGGIKIAPPANPDDDILDLVLVERHNIFRIFQLIIKLYQGKHLESALVHHFQSKKFEIYSPSVQFAHIDGESLGKHPYQLLITASKSLFWVGNK